MKRMRCKHIHKIRGTRPTVRINIHNPNFQMALLAVLILAGVATGSYIFKGAGSQISNFGMFLESAYTSATKSKSFLTLFFSSLFSSSLLILALFVLGLCAVGIPGLLVIPFFRGAGLGYTISFLYYQFGVKGVAFTALCIIPEAVLTSIAIVVSSREGIVFSLRLCSAILPSGGSQGLWGYFQDYCAKNAACLLFVAAAALLESLTALWLSGYLIP